MSKGLLSKDNRREVKVRGSQGQYVDLTGTQQIRNLLPWFGVASRKTYCCCYCIHTVQLHVLTLIDEFSWVSR